ncbi:hypothetical protein [Chiayiivirga flava]|uniref:Uncharacterized protein n=1 Tax=Chiayiivirga flava TaxID=659595 RepID=A0A7W8D5Z9_9GAMM|nr:hypothetical protein [Chiayiivirga flava]MBB5208564.1 hypothetical protein [Chiayiivirga flava]
MATKLPLLAVLLAGLSATASAQVWVPADGVWQIDGANGSGLTLDVRDDAIGVGLYTYDDAGNGTWYSGAGALVDGVLAVELTRFARGDGSPAAVDSLAVTLQFQASAAGTVSIGDGPARPMRQLAFGADYVEGLDLAGASGTTDAIPDLCGRWVFSDTAPGGMGSIDVTFISMQITDEGASFATEPADGTLDGGDYSVACGANPAAEDPPSLCLLYAHHDTLPPSERARFDPADLSAMRIAGAPTTAIGFRVPSTPNEPQSGIWQIAGRFGEGVTIDVRPDLIAVGVYGYDADGNATWSLATGAPVGDVLEADLVTFAGGSCIACEHTDPQIDSTRSMRLEFVGATRARLTIGDDAPLALSLLPFGADYLDKPLAGDPLAEEFGPHALPALGGAWAQTSVYATTPIDAPPFFKSSAYTFADVETVSLDGETYSALIAVPDEQWGPPSEFGGGSYASSIACEVGLGDDTADCSLINLGGFGSPPSGPTDIADILPWNMSATRISGVNLDGPFPEPVYLFRIPLRPAVDTTR